MHHLFWCRFLYWSKIIAPVVFTEMLILAKPKYDNGLGGAQGKSKGDKEHIWGIVALPKDVALFDTSSPSTVTTLGMRC
jgi:hypothetical protein